MANKSIRVYQGDTYSFQGKNGTDYAGNAPSCIGMVHHIPEHYIGAALYMFQMQEDHDEDYPESPNNYGERIEDLNALLYPRTRLLLCHKI